MRVFLEKGGASPGGRWDASHSQLITGNQNTGALVLDLRGSRALGESPQGQERN